MDAKKRQWFRRYYTGHECPGCPAPSCQIETNGRYGRAASFHCTACDMKWDAEQYAAVGA